KPDVLRAKRRLETLRRLHGKHILGIRSGAARRSSKRQLCRTDEVCVAMEMGKHLDGVVSSGPLFGAMGAGVWNYRRTVQFLPKWRDRNPAALNWFWRCVRPLADPVGACGAWCCAVTGLW